ncbi:hypothetical protein D9Q98_007569 [Chlorella vulgaris]|uniref:Uncharacterized protein n=1 Tax=Chlorella vulgaris TaxID=3077 RepID=A0A9D4TLC8_CHLVU|nr:hypothetical protein D9Q98_007569 [Chlorella vulgaris]
MGRGRRVPRVGFVRLTTKQGPRGYYKGKGVAATGTHTSKGGYTQLESKQPQFVVPDLTGFKLGPYIACDGLKPRPQ